MTAASPPRALDPADHLGLIGVALRCVPPPPGRRDDAHQECTLVLCRAVGRWRPELGVKFDTYAVAGMKYALVQFRDRERNWWATWRDRSCPRSLVLFSEFGGDFVRGRHEAFGRDDPEHPAERADEAAAAREAVGHYLDRLAARFDQRYADVLRMWYAEGRTLLEISMRYGVTRERVRQIAARGAVAVRDMAARDAAPFLPPPADEDDSYDF